MIVADTLGVPIEDIEVMHGDTDVVPRGVGTFGSRSLQTGGVAVNQAAGEVVDKARELASDLLEARSTTSSSTRSPAGSMSPAPRGRPELASSSRQASLDRDGSRLMAEVDFTAPGPTFPFGAHVAVVDVDTETGKVTPAAPHLCRRRRPILNPLLAEGQVHGGIAQGVGQALLEEFAYDDDGNPLTGNLADYAFPSAAELPELRDAFTETPTPLNALGAKGIGESGTIGSTPAVQNAVVDALGHLGVRHVDMPTTPIGSGRQLRPRPARPRVSTSTTSPLPGDEGAEVKVTMTVNGVTEEHDVEPRLLLVHYLRDVLGLTGTKSGATRPRAAPARS